MDEQRVEVGVKDSFKKTFVRSRQKRTGHVERIGYEKLAESRCPEKVKGNGGEEDRNSDGIVLKEIQKEWQKNAEKRATEKELETAESLVAITHQVH